MFKNAQIVPIHKAIEQMQHSFQPDIVSILKSSYALSGQAQQKMNVDAIIEDTTVGALPANDAGTSHTSATTKRHPSNPELIRSRGRGTTSQPFKLRMNTNERNKAAFYADVGARIQFDVLKTDEFFHF